MSETGKIMPSVLALLVGAALFFLLPITLGQLIGDGAPLMLPALLTAYGVCGAAFGYMRPRIGWRFGLYLSAVWPLMLLLSLFLAGEAVLGGAMSRGGVLRDLLECLLVSVAACLGAGIGAAVGGRGMSGHRLTDGKSS